MTQIKPHYVKEPLNAGDSLAYQTPQGWAYSGHRFHEWENGNLVTREAFACGTVRFERYYPQNWAVIRGTDVLPLM
jgi:hypothetical protein